MDGGADEETTVRKSLVDWKNLGRVAGASAAVVTVLQAGTATVALRTGRRDYADGVWGPGLAAVAITGALVGKGDVVRRWSLAAGVTGWAARLGWQMTKRLRRSDSEDARYTEFLEGASTFGVINKVFVTQGLSQLLVAAPIQLAAASRLPKSGRKVLFPIGLGVMAAGAVIEALADHQKTVFKQQQAERDEKDKSSDEKRSTERDILDTGLWGWSRHPNYFGDSVVWDGAFLAAAASAPGLLTVPAPGLMSYLLIFATGAKRTERRMADRPGYRGYQDRVAFFIPRRPKRTDR